MRGLMWFTNDLRLQDNEALCAAIRECSTLLCVYCVNPSELKSNAFDCQRLGPHRQGFIRQSLESLKASLQALGQSLLIVEGSPSRRIAALCQQFGIDRVYTADPLGSDERRQLDSLTKIIGKERVSTHNQYSMFGSEQHAQTFVDGKFPASFSKFRKLMGSQTLSPPTPEPADLPPPLLGHWLAPDPLNAFLQHPAKTRAHPRFTGGESEAWHQIEQYFASRAASDYKNTRNQLEGEYFSSQWSPWLASGCVSARSLAARLRQYEREHGSNDSTKRLYTELLWRDFFHAYSRFYGSRLFHFGGIADRKPLTTFYPQRFMQWRTGTTPWPLVNAAMHELCETGYTSNRSRQILASCLVNEYQCDWRAGAWWFQHQLIDHDVASNWGNWQYIAGVGADTRGGRHFDLEKQTRLYDPDQTFIQRWQGEQGYAAMDTVDAADWPIG